MSTFIYQAPEESVRTLTEAEVYYDAQVTDPTSYIPVAVPVAGGVTLHPHDTSNKLSCNCTRCSRGGCCRRRRRQEKHRGGFCPFALCWLYDDERQDKQQSYD